MSAILLADDDTLLGELVRFLLEGAGHSVRVAEDGAAALSALRDRQPDLLLLDCIMPGLTGPYVLAEMMRDPVLAHVPVLMLTARRDDADVRTALSAGADDYLAKPFRPDELLGRVERLLVARERAA